MEERFPKKRVLITGAGGRLGKALALEFAKRRWKVAVTGLDPVEIIEPRKLAPPSSTIDDNIDDAIANVD